MHTERKRQFTEATMQNLNGWYSSDGEHLHHVLYADLQATSDFILQLSRIAIYAITKPAVSRQGTGCSVFQGKAY